jgi:hypothetical protein
MGIDRAHRLWRQGAVKCRIVGRVGVFVRAGRALAHRRGTRDRRLREHTCSTAPMLTYQDDGELKTLKKLYPEARSEALRFVGLQIGTIENMAQALMTMAGILLAITTGLLPTLSTLSSATRLTFAAASALVLASALCNASTVFRVAWISRNPAGECSAEFLLESAVAIRNRKTRGYHIALGLMLLALVGYLSSIFLLAINPLLWR